MLNRSGVKKSTYAAPVQILANVEFQMSVGCIVPQSMGVIEGGRKIAKAGTPLKLNLQNAQTPAVAPTPAVDTTPATPMNAVLLHDVDVTDGAANGTGLIFGFVNLNRVDTATQTKITTAAAITGSTQMITFLKA